jgi:hypothetical protein
MMSCGLTRLTVALVCPAGRSASQSTVLEITDPVRPLVWRANGIRRALTAAVKP